MNNLEEKSSNTLKREIGTKSIFFMKRFFNVFENFLKFCFSVQDWTAIEVKDWVLKHGEIFGSCAEALER